MSAFPQIRRVDLLPSEWLTLTPPQPYRRVSVSNLDGGSTVRVRSDVNDVDTEIAIPPGDTWVLDAGDNPVPTLMLSGAAVAAQADSGAGPLTVVWS